MSIDSKNTFQLIRSTDARIFLGSIWHQIATDVYFGLSVLNAWQSELATELQRNKLFKPLKSSEKNSQSFKELFWFFQFTNFLSFSMP